MASKTVTRSILENYRELHFLPWLNLHIIIIHYYQEYYNETFVFPKILRPGLDAAPLMCPT